MARVSSSATFVCTDVRMMGMNDVSQEDGRDNGTGLCANRTRVARLGVERIRGRP